MHVGEQTRTRPYDCRGILGIVCLLWNIFCYENMRACRNALLLVLEHLRYENMRACKRAFVCARIRKEHVRICTTRHERKPKFGLPSCGVCVHADVFLLDTALVLFVRIRLRG